MSYRERRFTLRNGLNLNFWDYGDPLSDGTPVLCLAGLTRNSKKFLDCTERLATVKPGLRRVGVWETGLTPSLDELEYDDAIEAFLANV